MTVTDEGRRLLEAVAAALYDDGCIVPPRTDHAEHVMEALRLPAFLTAVEALERLTEAGQDVTPTAGLADPGPGDWARFSEAWHAARAALAPFTEEPSDAE